jgi:hypothetical protein
MVDSSVSLLFPARVRGEVLAQHTSLRALLQRALAATTRRLCGQDAPLDEVAASVRELHERFRAHLTFEERALVPIVACEEVWGPERAKSLLEEHERQRAQLDTLLEGIAAGWDLQHLALGLRSLTVDLLQDMQDEEDGLLRLPLLEELVVDARSPR